MSASLNFVPRSPCLPHPSSSPTWHHTWSSTRSCLNSAIKIQLKCSHSQVDIFHPIHITPFAAFDTTTLYPSPKLFPFINYHEGAALVLCTPVLLKPRSGHSPLRAPQGLVSYLLIFNSLRAVTFQNGSDHQLCADGSLSPPSSSGFPLYCHLNWGTDSTVPPPPYFSFSVGETIRSCKSELWNSLLISPFLLLPHGQPTTLSFLSLLARGFFF